MTGKTYKARLMGMHTKDNDDLKNWYDSLDGGERYLVPIYERTYDYLIHGSDGTYQMYHVIVMINQADYYATFSFRFAHTEMHKDDPISPDAFAQFCLCITAMYNEKKVKITELLSEHTPYFVFDTTR